MAIIRHLQTGFHGGELDPLLNGRVDTEQYGFAVETCENFVPVVEGPLVKRPGFAYIRDAAPTAEWLSAFRVSLLQEYVQEWSDLKLRLFTNGARVETAPNVAYEVATPYTGVQARALSLQQSFDRQYLDHASFAPRRLTRTSAITFTLDVSPLTRGPFADQNSVKTVTVQASGGAVGAVVTLTASSAIFRTGHVGTPFRLEAKDFSDLRAWEPGMKLIALNDKVRSDGKAYQASDVTRTVTGTIQPTHSEGVEYDGQGKTDELNIKGPYGVGWTYLFDRYGEATITALGGASPALTATATVTRTLPDRVVTQASYRWSYAAFSDDAGWPNLVTHLFGRQIHIKGFEILGSVAGDLLNHATISEAGTVTADMAFRRTIATDDPPLWCAGDRSLLLGTATRELAVGPVNAAAALAGDNIGAQPQSFYGSEAVFPVQLGIDVVFVERGGRRLRASSYGFDRDRYDAIDLTAAARHVTKSGIVQLAYQRVPYTLLHAVRGDGQTIVHAKTRLEMKGFARMALGGGALVKSLVAVVGADGKADELWALVSRVTPAGTRREIWKQEPWRELGDDPKAAFFVDGGFRAAAAGGQTVFPGALHLASQTIVCLAGGGVIRNVAVDAAGGFVLPATAVPAAAYTLIGGLPYTARAVLLRPPARNRNGAVQGMLQRVNKAVLRVLETLGLKTGGREVRGDGTVYDGPLEDTIDRPASAAMDAAIPLFSGDTNGTVDTEINRLGQLVFQSSDPLPAVVTAAMMNLDASESDA